MQNFGISGPGLSAQETAMRSRETPEQQPTSENASSSAAAKPHFDGTLVNHTLPAKMQVGCPAGFECVRV